MEKYESFELKVVKYICIVVCVITISGIGSCQSTKYQIRKSVEAGASPIEAACAFGHGSVSDSTLCAIELLKDKP